VNDLAARVLTAEELFMPEPLLLKKKPQREARASIGVLPLMDKEPP
jgi:hypothetical protein